MPWHPQGARPTSSKSSASSKTSWRGSRCCSRSTCTCRWRRRTPVLLSNTRRPRVGRCQTRRSVKSSAPSGRRTPRWLLYPLLTLEDRIGQQMASQRFGAAVLGALGGIAILLTALGAYVLGESMASMRMREMGIRAALGATRRQLRHRAGGNGAADRAGPRRRPRARVAGRQHHPQLPLPGAAARSRDARVCRGTILALAVIVSLRPALRAARVDLASVLKD